MQNIRACMNRIVEEEDVRKEIRNFNEYMFDFLLRRYSGSIKRTEETILNIVKTVESLKGKFRQVALFFEFMNESLSPEDISCFLLIRSLIEKELKITIWNKNTKQVLDLNFIALTKKQTNRIISRFLGEEHDNIVSAVLAKFMKEYQSVITPQEWILIFRPTQGMLSRSTI